MVDMTRRSLGRPYPGADAVLDQLERLRPDGGTLGLLRAIRIHDLTVDQRRRVDALAQRWQVR